MRWGPGFPNGWRTRPSPLAAGPGGGRRLHHLLGTLRGRRGRPAALEQRQHPLPGWATLLLLSWIPMCVATLAYVVLYVPNAVIVPLSLIWALIAWGAFARTSSDAPSRTPS